MFRKIGVLLVMCPAFFALIIVRMLRPWVLIRFACLPGNRVGHFALDTESYCCTRDLEKHTTPVLDFFYYNAPISNNQLRKMWGRIIKVSWFAREVDRFNRLFPGYKSHLAPMPSNRDYKDFPGYSSAMHQRDTQGVLMRAPIHLSFTLEEEDAGRAALRKIGVPDNAPFVCIYGRDPAYLDKVFSGKNWRYHDYRDSNIRNYLPAAEELVRRGYFVIRLGYIVKEKLNSNNPMIIDYASYLRTDFLDIYLGAKCRFFLGVLGGIVSVPMIFRRPVAGVDCIPIDHTHSGNPQDITIIKKLRWRKSGRFLTLREMFDTGAAGFFESGQYAQMGIDVVDNIPEEITALAIEMDERLEGIWQTTEEDEILQRKFWDVFKKQDPRGNFVSRISAEFLRHNPELIEHEPTMKCHGLSVLRRKSESGKSMVS